MTRETAREKLKKAMEVEELSWELREAIRMTLDDTAEWFTEITTVGTYRTKDYRCNYCGHKEPVKSRYCPGCGRRMEGIK